MSTKAIRQFACQACGTVFPKWIGRCTSCNTWSSLVEEHVAHKKAQGGVRTATLARPIGEIDADRIAAIPTGLGEFDRVLGGGAVLGGVTLVGGDPGIGKSTLLLQALAGLTKRGHRALYVSGEESAGQTAARARRLGAVEDELFVLAENDLPTIEAALDTVKPAAFVLDSVQTVRAPELESSPGTVSQLREVANRMVDRAKQGHIATFLIGHVTKEGALAGPKVLEHLVDTVLAFEGDRGHPFRSLRTQKNRFGSSTEVGIFEMTAEGMREVPNPSAFFLAERPRESAGSVIAAIGEGSRAMLVEVQALVSPFAYGTARRTATGVDLGRLAMLLAVLERKAGIPLSTFDVFVNIAGGIRVEEPGIDLAVALAVASSVQNRPIREGLVVFGEIGLAGEIRGVARTPARLAEATAMGFAQAIGPTSAGEVKHSGPLTLIPVRSLSEALDHAF